MWKRAVQKTLQHLLLLVPDFQCDLWLLSKQPCQAHHTSSKAHRHAAMGQGTFTASRNVNGRKGPERSYPGGQLCSTLGAQEPCQQKLLRQSCTEIGLLSGSFSTALPGSNGLDQALVNT
jgi:hypothetical protein